MERSGVKWRGKRFRDKALERMKEYSNISALSRELGVTRSIAGLLEVRRSR